LDTVGGQVHEDSYKVLKRGGRLVYLLAKPFNELSGDYGVEDIQVNVYGQTANLVKVIEFASKGIIKPIIGHALGLSDFRKAFELGESGQAGGKIVLTIPV
jgi:NADPH:quinone reductase-like Zn-dependent oxidoreductase